MPMSQPDKEPEPSIDEILDSIRRSIVPDDDAGKPVARKQASRKSAQAAKGRRGGGEAARAGATAASEKTEREAGSTCNEGPAPENGVDEGRTADGAVRFDDVDNPPGLAAGVGATASATASGHAAAAASAAPDAALLSPRTSAAVDTAFSSLSHMVLSQPPRTLEDLVRDMLRPMLKQWLDANLPDMVERLVRAEIERVSRRG
jgi:cell pole-organizing protein PopZ